ncbi:MULTISPECIES: alkaline phosphatase D family protein [Streptomyces]|uniref:Alkaline phosphatase D family protein n=3 Tax=Streptomyces violaceoruber group TaxID=2867121 RepID=A0ACD4WTF9_STRVN|nr:MULTISPECIES: alkaline phosphatase D family protein [Streptomyces]BDD71900.1 alkaline phosphatase [Streptomyces coelicolor]MCW8121417.1 alkaline phosphatase family protein [Streptomyces anthocyanicus]MCZ4638247.1 alkaline phosphatase D family protein [Streptomyces rubrogriseus]MDX3346283.1 alkaline phosphatase D family protein [Streptomyces sp. ME02-6979A]MDX3406783.1 alkaline phosphatase D family protein [Streptomyces sp. ME02-6977A]
MAELRLGPLLRYTDGSCATVWVETDRPCTAEVRCADGARGTAHSFRIADHHYALVPVGGLTPGTATEYEVLLDGTGVWPPPDSRFPPSVIATPGDDDGMRVAFGSCRWAAPPSGGKGRVGPDALDTLSARVAADPSGTRPDVLLLLGDQVYADEISDATREWIAGRRDVTAGPGDQVADYEEYTRLYYESWLDPEVRWLLSTVPSCMIFDDHDVIDDWNTSAAWLADMRATDWWQERVLSGLMSYWVYQQLGNLSPDELAADPLYTTVREASDGTDAVREFAARADADPASVRWSYRRDFGRTRLLMVDSRAARVLDEDRRTMLDPGEAAWLREQVMEGRGDGDRDGDRDGGSDSGSDSDGAYDHLLIGTSLPWLLPHLVHDVEAWNAAMCGGERGARWARAGERIRRGADLEHWSAFPSSFDALGDLIADAGTGPGAPASVSVLSGDVHHAYVAEPSWPGRTPDARVAQLTCSPVHNSVPLSIRLGFRFGWSAPARALGRRIARHGRCAPPSVSWRRTGGPWFGNQIMTLTLRGRSARLRLEQARADRDGTHVLRTVADRELT